MTQCNIEQDRVYLGIQCTSEERDDIELVQNKITCALQASLPDSVPEEVNEDIATSYFKAALETLGNYKWLESNWWRRMKEKYYLPDTDVWIDFASCEFYVIQ